MFADIDTIIDIKKTGHISVIPKSGAVAQLFVCLLFWLLF